MFWLDPASVPTMGNYFRAGGYRTFYKGKWHVSNADLQIPGTHDQIVSYDDLGHRDPEKEQLYLDADRLGGYGFNGWIGPEPHGKAPLNSGGSAASGQGRDVSFAAQTVEILQRLDASRQNDPWMLVASRFFDDTSIVFTSDHIDLLPTLLSLAGLDPSYLHEEVARGHSDPRGLVGRNLQPLMLGKIATVTDPIYFMTDDDPSRGLNQENVFGVAYDSVVQPNHIETVIVEIAGEVWKYSCYFDNFQFWSDPEPLVGPARDVVITVDDTPIDIPGEHQAAATKRVKFTPKADEFEMYNVTHDPMELHNLSGSRTYAAMEAHLARLLAEQRELKRLLRCPTRVGDDKQDVLNLFVLE